LSTKTTAGSASRLSANFCCRELRRFYFGRENRAAKIDRFLCQTTDLVKR